MRSFASNFRGAKPPPLLTVCVTLTAYDSTHQTKARIIRILEMVARSNARNPYGGRVLLLYTWCHIQILVSTERLAPGHPDTAPCFAPSTRTRDRSAPPHSVSHTTPLAPLHARAGPVGPSRPFLSTHACGFARSTLHAQAGIWKAYVLLQSSELVLQHIEENTYNMRLKTYETFRT
jgi:hypothetical protein